MWKPSDKKWLQKAECGKPENKQYVDGFFSKVPKEKYAAKNLCFSCPVRQECLQWALENKQIWGVWGGKDEVEIRRTLSVSYKGEEARRRRYPNCPYCNARPFQLDTRTEDVAGGGRWTTARVVECTECGFSWKSRTSANAIEAYKKMRSERLARRERERARKLKSKRKKNKNYSTESPS